jgi:cytosine/adenosine deaminase-related metal-dependent hydrolase
MNASRLVVEGCAVATVDPGGSEYESGHVVVEGNRIVAVGDGPAPEQYARDARRIDGGGCLATPGLVNCHHHLYQWATRGLAQQATLFEWLVELLLVNGEPVVENGGLGTADEGEISRGIAAASRRLAERAEEVAL